MCCVRVSCRRSAALLVKYRLAGVNCSAEVRSNEKSEMKYVRYFFLWYIEFLSLYFIFLFGSAFRQT